MMKTQSYGTGIGMGQPELGSPFLQFSERSRYRPPFEKYKANRTNGTDADSPAWPLPEDGKYSWVTPNKKFSNIRYDEGPGDRAWMEERDSNYVFRLEREGRLDKVEPNLKIEVPKLYREVMAARQQRQASQKIKMVQEQWQRQATEEKEAKEAAERAFQKIKQEHERAELAESLRKFAQKKRMAGNFKGGLADIEASLQIEPNNAWALKIRGEIKRVLKDYRGALVDLNASLRLEPNDTFAVNSRNKVQKDIEEDAKRQVQAETARLEAEAQINKKRELNEKISKVSQNLAMLKQTRRAGKTDASALNQQYQELEPLALELGHVEFFIDRGDFYNESAQSSAINVQKEMLYIRAVQSYEQALCLDPFSAAADKLEQVKYQLNSSKQSAVAPAASRQGSYQQTLTRANLTPEQLIQLEAMKAQLRGKPAPSSLPPDSLSTSQAKIKPNATKSAFPFRLFPPRPSSVSSSSAANNTNSIPQKLEEQEARLRTMSSSKPTFR